MTLTIQSQYLPMMGQCYGSKRYSSNDVQLIYRQVNNQSQNAQTALKTETM